MKCYLCKKALKEGDKVLPILTYIVSEKHGEFVNNASPQYVHVRHLKTIELTSSNG